MPPLDFITELVDDPGANLGGHLPAEGGGADGGLIWADVEKMLDVADDVSDVLVSHGLRREPIPPVLNPLDLGEHVLPDRPDLEREEGRHAATIGASKIH